MKEVDPKSTSRALAFELWMKAPCPCPSSSTTLSPQRDICGIYNHRSVPLSFRTVLSLCRIGGSSLWEKALCFFPRQENPHQCHNQGEGGQTDKAPFKSVNGHAHDGGLRGTVIPSQVKTVPHEQDRGNDHNAGA